ncbi:uncharacterized protein TNIN_84041 [Trichonephila inaurata madagascariensis]|uniref:Uncharacterized protein n=1 Tax=Trichonephila inaurata madagascariensis TaxID=2747483 RepID=A0A8X6XCY5_9ARAC|nr:uncharacterized protein TNIN_84041 [Trichonephila inaurata madagascariensis]
MNFLELIRPHLCHDPDCKSIVVLSNQPPAIRCEMCQQMPILNVYHFIREAANVDLLGASHLALMYYVLTEKLVSYVKACREDWTPFPPEEEESNLIKQLLNQLQRSMAIRKMFSRYCIPFDIFHVLVGCYACCSDIGMVANWALDLMARICRGQFFWKEYESCAFVQQILCGIKSDVTYKRNTDLYYVMRSIQKGEGIECLSENFAKYGQLEKLVKEKIQAPMDLVDMVSHQLFPNILFDHHADQLAFNIAMGHVACSMDLKTAQVKKGAFSKARRLYGIISKLVKQVEAFDAQYPIPWTIDTLTSIFES